MTESKSSKPSFEQAVQRLGDSVFDSDVLTTFERGVARLNLFKRELGPILPLFALDDLKLKFLHSAYPNATNVWADHDWHLEGIDVVASLTWETPDDADEDYERSKRADLSLRLQGVMLRPTSEYFGFQRDSWQTPVALACHHLGEEFNLRGLQTLAALSLLVFPWFGYVMPYHGGYLPVPGAQKPSERTVAHWLAFYTGAIRPAVADRIKRYVGALRVSLGAHLPPPLCRLVVGYVGQPAVDEIRPEKKSSTQLKQERKKGGGGGAKRGGKGKRGGKS